jgi:hypothetical protein
MLAFHAQNPPLFTTVYLNIFFSLIFDKSNTHSLVVYRSAYVSIRQHTSADEERVGINQSNTHTFAREHCQQTPNLKRNQDLQSILQSI